MVRLLRVARGSLVLTALAVLTVVAGVAASADTARARFSAAGAILYVGPNQFPPPFTTTSSRFQLNRDGTVKNVRISTTAEQVVGALGGVTSCRDADGGVSCGQLNSIVAGNLIMSLHDSEALLRVTSQGPLPAPYPPLEVLNGDLIGRLQGQVTIGVAPDVMAGTARLRITEGSTGTYACYVASIPSFVPSLAPCIGGVPTAMLVPVMLNVQDRGTFEITEAFGALSGVSMLRGQVEVNASADLLAATFGGTINITHGVFMAE
jgi:hypothetical protein